MTTQLILVIAVSYIVFISAYSKILYTNKKMMKDFLKTKTENILLEEYVKVLDNEKFQSDENIHKENFIKFISESRDYAYKYIEDVQVGISKFIEDVEPEIAYFDEYGIVGSAYPHYYSMKKIS